MLPSRPDPSRLRNCLAQDVKIDQRHRSEFAGVFPQGLPNPGAEIRRSSVWKPALCDVVISPTSIQAALSTIAPVTAFRSQLRGFRSNHLKTGAPQPTLRSRKGSTP